jgi:hypothetical protein
MRRLGHAMRSGRSRHATGSGRAAGFGRATLALVGALVIAAVAVTACAQPGPTPEPQYTSLLIGATPWPSGTTGQYGLHIDPSLLGKLPRSVDAEPLLEDAESESVALDNADLAKTFDGYAAASIGEVGDADWLNLAIGHFQPDNQTPDVYSAWVDQYATGACSQADGVSSATQSTINDWLVDVATCGGGPTVYTLSLGGGVVLSMFGYGPRDLGRQLIGALY